MLVEIPPINSRTKEFALIKAYNPPIYINLFNKFVLEKSIENNNNRIKYIII